MGCVDPDGTLSSQAQSILNELDTSRDVKEVAQKTGLPLYRVRSALRELSEEGLVEEVDGRYRVSDASKS